MIFKILESDMMAHAWNPSTKMNKSFILPQTSPLMLPKIGPLHIPQNKYLILPKTSASYSPTEAPLYSSYFRKQDTDCQNADSWSTKKGRDVSTVSFRGYQGVLWGIQWPRLKAPLCKSRCTKRFEWHPAGVQQDHWHELGIHSQATCWCLPAETAGRWGTICCCRTGL